ncbi:hypothetical protein WJX82_007018 [Trebouxia sp. C0006]
MTTAAAAGLILILKDGKPRQEVDLVARQCLSMGKSPNNSIILPDKGIRSEHIKLQVDGQGQALFDSLGHKNVLVNGRLEQGPVQLKDGDLIEVLRKHDGPRQFQQQQLQSESGLLLQHDAATQADFAPASQATLEQHLAEKAVEMRILQELNDRLSVQASSLQQQLSSLQMARSIQDAVKAQAGDTEELVEPTLVLPSPSESTDGQAAGHANQQPPGQSTLPEGQPTKLEGQVDVFDGQNTIPEGQSTKPDRHATASDGQCDKPAHLGCVGMEAVPEGDWFCATCTAIMACGIMAEEHSVQAQQCGQGQALQQSSGADNVIGPEPSGAEGKALGKRMGPPVVGPLAAAAGDTKGNAGQPVKKRSRCTISGGKAQQNKENAAANQPAVKKRRQTQCPARAVKKAPMCATDMKAQGPRRSTRLADK